MDHIEDQRIQLNNDEHVQHIKISSIKVNPYQPRKTFDEEKLQDLAWYTSTYCFKKNDQWILYRCRRTTFSSF